MARPAWLASAWAIPEARTVTEWAESALVLDGRSGSTPGPFRVFRTPYLRGVIDAFGDRETEEITMVKPTQCGGTTAIYAMLGYAITEDPGPALLVLPNTDLARSMAKTRLKPIFDGSPEIAKHKPSDSDQYQNLEMQFGRMTVTLVGSNSPANVASRPVRYLMLDEIDKYARATERESSAAALAMERTATFWNRKIVKTSTPTVPEGEIWRAWLQGDQRRFHVPCPFCEEHQALEFSQLKWPESAKTADGWNLDAVRYGTYYECSHCGEAIPEQERYRMGARGEWRPTVTDYSVRRKSFRITSLDSLFRPWGETASKFLSAKNDLGELQNFVNSWLAEPWEGAVENVEEAEVLACRGEYPPGHCPITPEAVILSVDVQRDCVWYVVRAWGQHESSWLLRYGTLPGLAALQDMLDATYYDGQGQPIKVNLAIVDSGDQTDEVYRWCQTTGFLSCKGATNLTQPIVWTEVKAYGIKLLSYQANTFKDQLAKKILAPRGDFGGWSLHQATGGDYARQLTAEQQVQTRNRWGFPVRQWKKRRGDNHLLDCEVMQLAMATATGLRYGAVT